MTVMVLSWRHAPFSFEQVTMLKGSIDVVRPDGLNHEADTSQAGTLRCTW
jgi:hypothetical protein